MSDIATWSTDDAWESEDGDFVTYADHLAAVAAAVEAVWQARVTDAETWVAKSRAMEQRGEAAGYRVGFTDALDKARDAVDAVWSAPDGLLRGLCNHAEALAAIDALRDQT